MLIHRFAGPDQTLVLGWGDLPELRFYTGLPVDAQIADYLLTIIRVCRKRSAFNAMIPCAASLAFFLGCATEDIVQALWEVRHQGYDYDLLTVQDPITLRCRPADVQEGGANPLTA